AHPDRGRRPGGLRRDRHRPIRADRPPGPRGRGGAARPLQPDPQARPARPDPVPRPPEAARRHARAGHHLPAAAGDHGGQRHDLDRHGALLPCRGPGAGVVCRGEPDRGDGAARHHHAAQRHRLAVARGDADVARQDQPGAPHRPRRRHGSLGHPHQPHRAEVDRPARLDPGGDGEADAGGALQARHDPRGGGREGVGDPLGGGSAPVADPAGRGPAAGADPRGRGRPAGRRPARERRGRGGARRLPGDPRGQPVARPPGLQVPRDPPAGRERPGHEARHGPLRCDRRARLGRVVRRGVRGRPLDGRGPGGRAADDTDERQDPRRM
ncbi:MAG: Protein QmcA (possibly involved in integral membrane quality control), partial [uncultured Thermoleophilia bacterium]